MDLKNFFKKNKVYFVSDSALSKKKVLNDIESALKGGIKIIQYREKSLSSKKMLEECLALKKLCKKFNALLIVNDRIDICLACNADGVHLGQEDLPLKIARKIFEGKKVAGKKGKNFKNRKIIGVTVHNLSEAIVAEKDGADYLGISPIFETSTKKDAGKPAGLELIKKIKAKVKIPCVAIGGINEENMLSVFKAGADCVAMVSDIACAENVENKTKRINCKIKKF